MEHIAQQLQIWGTIGTSWLAAWSLSDMNQLASIIALICGAIASLSIAYYHIFKKPKPPKQ